VIDLVADWAEVVRLLQVNVAEVITRFAGSAIGMTLGAVSCHEFDRMIVIA